MSKICQISGKKVQFGNNVSKSINKTFVVIKLARESKELSIFSFFKYPVLKSLMAKISAALFCLLLIILLKPNKLHNKVDLCSSFVCDVIS